MQNFLKDFVEFNKGGDKMSKLQESINRDKGATDFVNFMYDKYPEAEFYRENSITVDGEPVIALYFDISKMGKDAFDTILSLDQDLIDKSLEVAVRGRNNNILIAYCRDDEDWDELDESYVKEDFYADNGDYFMTPVLNPANPKGWINEWEEIIRNNVNEDAARDFRYDLNEYTELNEEMIKDLLSTVDKSNKTLLEVVNSMDAMLNGKSEFDKERMGTLLDLIDNVRRDLEDAYLWQEEIDSYN